MGYARSKLVDFSRPGIYHCTTRCVRQCWLLQDGVTHRKGWLRRRLFGLARLFSVSIDSFAVMDNHYHVQLYIDPQAPQRWPDAEVARRWVSLYPRKHDDDARIGAREAALLEDSERLAECRRRLGSLSEFMAHLNEYIARRANAEDGCKGRFWEGRFRCQAILDASSRLRCMAYIELNPLRAGSTSPVNCAPNTSAGWRRGRHRPSEPLRPVVGSVDSPEYGMTLGEYSEYLEWAGATQCPKTRSHSPRCAVDAGNPGEALDGGALTALLHACRRAFGSTRGAFEDKARRAGQSWLWGTSTAR